MALGNLVTLEIFPDGLHIRLEPEGKEYLQGEIEERDELTTEIFWGRPYEDVWVELLERYANNGGPELLNMHTEDYERIGALTDAPIIGYDVERDDMYDLVGIGRAFWFPRYAIESELEILFDTGEVIFEEAHGH